MTRYKQTMKEALAKVRKEEPANPDEMEMAHTQLEFIEYAVNEVEEYIKSGVDFPEWLQNKLTKAHEVMKDIHAYMEGERSKGAEYGEQKESVELTEASAGADARRAMRHDPDMTQKFSKDVKATDADKAASAKNMIVQLRKSSDVKGNYPIEFADGKKQKVDAKVIDTLLKAHDKIQKPSDKEKFVAMISKSYRDMLNVTKMVATQLKMGEEISFGEELEEKFVVVYKHKATGAKLKSTVSTYASAKMSADMLKAQGHTVLDIIEEETNSDGLSEGLTMMAYNKKEKKKHQLSDGQKLTYKGQKYESEGVTKNIVFVIKGQDGKKIALLKPDVEAALANGDMVIHDFARVWQPEEVQEAYRPVKKGHYDVKVTVKNDRDAEKISDWITYNTGERYDIEDIDTDDVIQGGSGFKKGDIKIMGDDAGEYGLEIAKKFGSKVVVVGESVELEEKLKVSDGLGAWIDDFKKSDAPQFKGKSDEEKKNMAIAAFTDAGGKLESVQESAAKYLSRQIGNIQTRNNFATGKSRIPTPAERRAEMEKQKKKEETEIDESVDAKKVVDYLVKKGNNPKDAQKMVDKQLAYVNKTYKGVTVAKAAEIISSLKEEKEINEVDFNSVIPLLYGAGVGIVLPALMIYSLLPSSSKEKREAEAAAVANLLPKFRDNKNYKPNSAEIEASKEFVNDVKDNKPSLYKSVMAKLKSMKLKEEEEPKNDQAKSVEQERDDKKKTRIAQLQLQIAKAQEMINRLNRQTELDKMNKGENYA